MFSFMVITGLSACDTDDRNSLEVSENTENNKEDDDSEESMKLKITVGTVVFIATLQDNATANYLKKLLPMTVSMTEHAGNEKYYDLKGSLPINPSSPETIQNGDLMLYGSKTLVLFYKSISTSYSYTRLGRVDDTTGLTSALGSGNVTITFELDKKE